MSTSNFITGVLVGALAGLAVGLLCAPGKGSETRQKLMDRGNDLANSLKERFNRVTGTGVGDQIQDAAIKGKRKAKDIADKAENKIEEWQDQAGGSFTTG